LGNQLTTHTWNDLLITAELHFIWQKKAYYTKSSYIYKTKVSSDKKRTLKKRKNHWSKNKSTGFFLSRNQLIFFTSKLTGFHIPRRIVFRQLSTTATFYFHILLTYYKLRRVCWYLALFSFPNKNLSFCHCTIQIICLFCHLY